MCVTPITVWVVSKHESNCLSENKMLSTLIWRHVSLLYVVQSNMLWRTILLSYHYRCNVVFTNYRFPVSFLLYIATQNLTNHYCEQFYEYSYHQKNTSCTLCVPMFSFKLECRDFTSSTTNFTFHQSNRSQIKLLCDKDCTCLNGRH